MRRLMMVLVLVLAPGLSRSLAQDIPGVDGDFYTDPLYDYTLSWNPDDWEPVADPVADLALRGDVSLVTFQSGSFYRGDAVACRDDLLDRLSRSAGVEDFARLLGPDGDAIAAEEPGRASAAVTLMFTDPAERRSEPVAQTRVIACQTLVPGDAILAIRSVSETNDQADAFAALGDLLATLTISRGPAGAIGPMDSDDAVYVHETYGHSFRWDPEIWTPYQPTGFDLGLNSGTSFVLFVAVTAYDGDAEACLDEYTRLLDVDDGVSDIAPIDDDAGGALAGRDGEFGVYAAYQLTYTPPGGAPQARFNVLRCLTVAPGEAVMYSNHIGPLENFAQEWERSEGIFASFQAPAVEPATPEPIVTPVATETPDVATPTAPPPTVTPTPTVPPTPTATPDSLGDPPVEDTPTPPPTPAAEELSQPATFANPIFGWSLTYDAADWLNLDPLFYARTDLALRGDGGIVTFQSLTGYMGDAQACIADLSANDPALTPGAGPFVDAVELVDGPTPERARAVVMYETSVGRDAILALECRALSLPGTVLVIRHFTTVDDYPQAAADVERLLEGLEIEILDP